MAKTTTDHDEIRQWVESRGGTPASVADTGSGDDPGILRINFENEPGGDDDSGLQEISWEEFFRAFDENNLAFLYEDEGDSRFNKFVSRDS